MAGYTCGHVEGHSAVSCCAAALQDVGQAQVPETETLSDLGPSITQEG